MLRWLRGLIEPEPRRGLAAEFRPAAPDPAVFELRGFEFYVLLSASRHEQMLSVVGRAVGEHGTVYDQTSHAVVLWDEFAPPEDTLGEIAAELETDVIWLSFQKQVDALEFAHWVGRRKVRHLVYGCYSAERTWERVEGEAEPWEAAAIFDPRRLARCLKVRELVDSRGQSNTDEELRAVYAEQRLVPGSDEPSITAISVAAAAARAYSLPGWS